MIEIDAAPRTGSRRKARQFVDGLPADLRLETVQIRFAPRALVTVGFMDEVILSVLVDRRAALLTFTGLPDYGREVAEAVARHRQVRDRLSFDDERDPDQAWFWTDEWQRAEAEAQADIDAGRVTVYESDDAPFGTLDEMTAEG